MSFKKDYFRIFARASGINGTYPSNFYALVSNSSGEKFTEGSHNTLTLKKFDWTFKNTSKDVAFTEIEQVNFVSDHDSDFLLEGQWIFGKGRTKTSKSDLSKTSSKPACQYGAVDTTNFAYGPSSFFTSMYGLSGHLSFPCNLDASKPARTYQGVVSYTDSLNFFYAINPDTGRIQVCDGLPESFFQIRSLSQFTSGCKYNTVPDLVLKESEKEYYAAVNILGVGNTRLTVVSIKSRYYLGTWRQVVVSFGAGPLPTIDTSNYLYSVSRNRIWRGSTGSKFGPFYLEYITVGEDTGKSEQKSDKVVQEEQGPVII